jgi:hypothetical protein
MPCPDAFRVGDGGNVPRGGLPRTAWRAEDLQVFVGVGPAASRRHDLIDFPARSGREEAIAGTAVPLRSEEKMDPGAGREPAPHHDVAPVPSAPSVAASAAILFSCRAMTMSADSRISRGRLLILWANASTLSERAWTTFSARLRASASTIRKLDM